MSKRSKNTIFFFNNPRSLHLINIVLRNPAHNASEQTATLSPRRPVLTVGSWSEEKPTLTRALTADTCFNEDGETAPPNFLQKQLDVTERTSDNAKQSVCV